MSKLPDSRAEWATYFDETWELSDWLSEYGTVYHRPDTPSDNTYECPRTLPKPLRPDLVVDFESLGEIVSCFFANASDIEQFTLEMTQNGRLAQYALEKESVTINPPDSSSPQSPDGDLLLTQFAPFGHILFDTIPIPDINANTSMDNITEDDDLLTFLFGNILNRTITNVKYESRIKLNHDPFDTYHGILAGSTITEETRKPPSAMIAPHPDEHDFWYAYWKRFTTPV